VDANAATSTRWAARNISQKQTFQRKLEMKTEN